MEIVAFFTLLQLEDFFSLGKQFFEDQIRRTVFALCHKILARATEYYIAGQIWPVDR